MAYIKTHYKEILEGKNAGNPYAIQIFQALFNGTPQDTIDKMVENYMNGGNKGVVDMSINDIQMTEIKPAPVKKASVPQQPARKTEYTPKIKSSSDISDLKDMKGHVYHGDPDEYAEGYYDNDSESYDMNEYDSWYQGAQNSKNNNDDDD